MELTIDQLIGPVIYRVLITGGDASAISEIGDRLWDSLARGMAP